MRYKHLISAVEATDDEVKAYKSATFGALFNICCFEMFPIRKDLLFLVQLAAKLVTWTVFVASAFYSCGFLLNNPIFLLKLLQVLWVQLVQLGMGLFSNCYPEKLEKLYRFLAAADFVDYGSVMISIRKQLQQEVQDHRRTIIYPALFLLSAGNIIPFISAIVEPLLVSDSTSHYHNGIYTVLPVPLYFPFDSHEGLSHYACLFFEIFALASGYSVGACASCVILLSLERIIFELKMLCRSVQLIHERAELMSKDNPTMDFEECLHVCLLQNIIHHRMIKQTLQVFKSACNGMLFLGMTGTSVTIILGLTTLSNLLVEGQIAQGVVPSCLIFSTITMTFIVCLYGEGIATENDNLFNSLYFISWDSYPKKIKKLLLIYKEFVKEPMTVYFGIWPCNADNFSMMLRGAYSYFNMLNSISQSVKKNNI